jgi:D-alanyl-D-alanine carboxypeptidase (penicillin-binding protein 5/6)
VTPPPVRPGSGSGSATLGALAAGPFLEPTAEVSRVLGYCRDGVLVDWSAKRVLWQKDGERTAPVASLTKMMTTLLLMEAIEQRPGLSLDAVVPVTVAASKVGGSQVWLDPRESFTLGQLLKALVMHSANDVAHLIAEYVSDGDVTAFVADMNRRARELGLERTTFHNAHGLPEGGRENASTPLEMAFLAGTLLQYDEVVKWSSCWTDSFGKDTRAEPTMLVNRNDLVNSCPGVNGMKTGFTQAAMYCVAATCERNGRVLIACVLGCPTKSARKDLVTALLDWGYAAEG